MLKLLGRFVKKHWPWGVLLAVVGLWWLRGRPDLIPNGSDAPELVAQLSDGEQLELGTNLSEVLVLNFWASWCPSCRSEMKSLQTLHKRYASKGVQVVGLSTESGMALSSATAAAKALGSTYSIGLATDEQMRRFRVKALPTTYIVDKSGSIVAGFVGAVSERRLVEAIDGAL